MKSIFLTLLISLFLCLSVAAQSPKPASKSADVSAAKASVNQAVAADPLKLTEAELSELVALANEQQSLSNQLQAKINAVLTVSCQQCDKAALISAAAIDAHNYFQQTVKPASEKADARMREIQKAHNCEGCAIKGGAFVKPEKAEGAK